ncbi:hypothetical protein [Cerasicoccus arenae]|uniref:Lipoprotein n=1 Tax=Cerasicoccus arenae TaxID=424488 RepID=A0A8J3DEW3_9BACT|nr:hypothetical protein [Cerasicoccus arenae]MBK1859900.1 hypothetical protein [Cerasicoccus arenae]GHC12690.1 hypothetical protein GCM10007047_32600 [Cerasicoccus arenae]
MKIVKKFPLLVFACLAMWLTGCGESPSEPAAQSIKEEPLGILSVESSGNRMILNVFLKDQFKLQLFEGDVAGPQVWVNSTKSPAPVAIRLEADTLTIGSFKQPFDTTGIQMRTQFPEITPGAKEILIATNEKDGNSVPILLKLVPTTPEEKAKINSGKPISDGNG